MALPILAQFRSVTHRRHVEDRQSEPRDVIVDIERLRIARTDCKRRSIRGVEFRNIVSAV
jgi:hypothetical protein